ncbi:hypothetical protein [Mesotoga sp.]|uniref:hypothetical protein n=1 Tax=Mesotoga sp. TaxID=2053577 RepID=UPI00345ECDB5
MIPVYEVRVWRGSLPSIFVTEDEEEAIRTYEEQRRTAEQQHWWTKDRVELLRNDKLIRWASNDETGKLAQIPDSVSEYVSKFIMNDGRRVIGSYMVEDREQKYIKLLVKELDGKIKEQVVLGNFD